MGDMGVSFHPAGISLFSPQESLKSVPSRIGTPMAMAVWFKDPRLMSAVNKHPHCAQGVTWVLSQKPEDCDFVPHNKYSTVGAEERHRACNPEVDGSKPSLPAAPHSTLRECFPSPLSVQMPSGHFVPSHVKPWGFASVPTQSYVVQTLRKAVGTGNRWQAPEATLLCICGMPVGFSSAEAHSQ